MGGRERAFERGRRIPSGAARQGVGRLSRGGSGSVESCCWTPVNRMGLRDDPEARTILRARTGAIDQFAADFQEAVERDSVGTPLVMEVEARKTVWKFANVHAAMDREIIRLAQMGVPGSQSPDFALTVARIALAMYFLDKVGEMLRVVTATGKVSLTSLFRSTVTVVLGILDEGFFCKDSGRIINDYLDAEPLLVACSRACSVELLPLDEAVARYRQRVADEVCKVECRDCPG